MFKHTYFMVIFYKKSKRHTPVLYIKIFPTISFYYKNICKIPHLRTSSTTYRYCKLNLITISHHSNQIISDMYEITAYDLIPHFYELIST